ncbi:MAG TPA: hypothetical protein VLM76_12330 [Patescibacteria group bacterium]|nr:hypothetical protein [Patescibacteria group bacterium]
MRAWWSRKTLEERRAHVAQRNPERVRAADEARSRTRRKQESIVRSRLRHPERHAARQAVRNALRFGRLVRQPCHCGSARAEAHHPDYALPLQVEWLCRRHHVERHAANSAYSGIRIGTTESGRGAGGR